MFADDDFFLEMHFKCPNVQMPVFTWNIRKLYEVDVSRLAKQQKSHLASNIDVKKKGPDCRSQGQ